MKDKFTPEEINLLTDERTKAFCSLLAEGKKIAELATQFRTTPNTLRNLAKKARKQVESAQRVRKAVAEGRVSEILIADLLPPLWANALSNANLSTVGAVAQKSDAELLKCDRCFGKKGLRLLRERLVEFDICRQ